MSILSNLPSSLLYLDISHNAITEITQLPPNTLTSLICFCNRLIVLPQLPYNLTELCCQSNELEYLPELYEKLTFVNCSNNK